MIIGTDKVRTSLTVHKRYWLKEHYGRFVDQLIEEMSELTKELLKDRRSGNARPAALAGEIADVLLCLDYLLEAEGISREQISTLVDERAEGVTRKLLDWLKHTKRQANGEAQA